MEQLWSRAEATNRNGWQRERPRKRLNHLRTVVNDHFKPKSNRHLRPGQFWAIPLADGRFAAGRVMAVPAFGEKDMRGFVAGLMESARVRLMPPHSQAGPSSRRERRDSRRSRIPAARSSAIARSSSKALRVSIRWTMSVGAVHPVWGWRTILNHAERLESR